MKHSMNPMDVAILIVRTAERVIQTTDFRTAEQIIIETMHTHPELPWDLVINSMYAEDNRLWWARRALLSYNESNERPIVGNAA